MNGKETFFQNPKEAEQAGIAFIHQELNIWPEMTVLENLYIGREITRPFGVLKTKEMKALAKGVFDRLNIALPFDRLAGACSVGEQQMIEIAKALLTDAEVMIMDEPTAALTDREIQSLFSVIESLKKNHVSIV
ncbi:ATP-binding cassette domain-containing protein, partial [Kitasatospora sp. SC0581]